MKNISLFKKTLLAASIAALTACSDGGSSTPAGSTTAGTTSGVITNFGSVFVNGVEYFTDSTTISIDGVPSSESNLAVGDVVVLQGTVNADGKTGTATSISSADELEGYILDTANLGNDGTGSIDVMGQTVNISLDTVFDSDTFTAITDLKNADLTTGVIVEVHGYADGSGTVAATRIETKSTSSDVEVKGLVSAMGTDNAGNLTFMLGDLLVDYTNATEIPPNLADGLYIEVKTLSMPTGDITNGFVMTASKVEQEENGSMDIDGDLGEEIKMQGVISDITDTSFMFNGALVMLDTLEDNDFDPSSMMTGMMITVEGYIDANGDFIVKEIKENSTSDNEIGGMVTAITDSSITISTDTNGTTMTFTVDNNTRMMDEQDENQIMPVRKFSLSDIAQGDYIEIEYSDDDITVATELTRDDISQMPVMPGGNGGNTGGGNGGNTGGGNGGNTGGGNGGNTGGGNGGNTGGGNGGGSTTPMP
ncbi:HflK protein [hydrothermal vent metagenome]|uniref:HflK protein n=1 Tax=hydrothermal vent metagenome TaxID=652676 RepID=A0A3B0YD49_9ZZZZ